MTVRDSSPGIVERLQRQLIADDGIQDYIATARRLGHQLQIVLIVLPDGTLGSPKISIDTRGDTRGSARI